MVIKLCSMTRNQVKVEEVENISAPIFENIKKVKTTKIKSARDEKKGGTSLKA